MSGFIDYYELLEVSPRASREVIELAYKAIAKKYHPDLNDSSKREFYNLKMTLINEARAVLTDTYKRNQYDYKYRGQQVSYTDKSKTNSSNTTSSPKTEPDHPPKNSSDHTAEQKGSGRSSNDHESNEKATIRRERNAFEYFSVPLAVFLIIVVGIVVGIIMSNSFSESNLNSATNDTTNLTLNSSNDSTTESTKVQEASEVSHSIAASDTAEHIRGNIISISDFSWGKNESGSIQFDIDFRNNSLKTINSITIKIIIQDQNKNILASTDNGSTSANLLLPGPIKPNEIGGLGKYWNNAFTNINATYCYFDDIEIAYEDGTFYTFNARSTNLFE